MTKVINSLAKGEHEQKLLELMQDFKSNNSYYSQGLTKLLLNVLAYYNRDNMILYDGDIACVVGAFNELLDILRNAEFVSLEGSNFRIEHLERMMKKQGELIKDKEQIIKLQKERIAKLESKVEKS
jgi:hypothetical protein